ncbi:MAG: four helix bundle protein [bacterium]|nr:four helix bundle protein [bacterium]
MDIYATSLAFDKLFPRLQQIVYTNDAFEFISTINNYDRPTTSNTPPPTLSTTVPVVRKLIDLYVMWQECCGRLPRTARCSLGDRIDRLILDCVEEVSVAGFLTPANKKIHLAAVSKKIDTLKIYVQLLWEIKALDNRRTGQLATSLVEVGKMTGGWLKSLER